MRDKFGRNSVTGAHPNNDSLMATVCPELPESNTAVHLNTKFVMIDVKTEHMEGYLSVLNITLMFNFDYSTLGQLGEDSSNCSVSYLYLGAAQYTL